MTRRAVRRRRARVLGAGQVVVIDREPYRLAMAEKAGATTLDFTQVDVHQALLRLTRGRGPDKCVDAVGLDATHGSAHVDLYDRTKQALRAETGRPHALRQAITSCRRGAWCRSSASTAGSSPERLAIMVDRAC